MPRSLLFPYLFIVLAVSYFGGIILFRELPDTALEKTLSLLDDRVVNRSNDAWIFPIISTVISFGMVLILSQYTYSRPFIYLIGAMKSVLFGISSAYLLANGLKVYEYAVWWFPFQLAICFSLLLFTTVLAPPFFVQRYGKNTRNNKLLMTLIGIVFILITMENLIFFLIIQ